MRGGRQWVAWLGALALGLALLPGTLIGADELARPRERVAARPAVDEGTAGSARLEQIGYHELDPDGLHADVWLHRGYAYVGTWSAGTTRGRGCPGRGVVVVDLADPTRPTPVAHLAQHPGTTAEVMRVRSVATPYFQGDLLAVGLQACGGDALRGVDLWDVTNPREPRPLGFHATDVGGVHELDLVQRPDGRVLTLLAVPYSETSHPQRLGDFRVVEVTDPRAPRPLADWGAKRELGLDDDSGLGLDPVVYAHSVRASADGLRAYVSYWDAGVLLFDLADPEAPRLLGRTRFPPGAEGNAHSVDLADGEQVLIEADEVLDVVGHAIRVESPPSLAGLIAAGGSLPAPPWPDTTQVTGELAYLGRGCPAGDWTTALAGRGARIDTPDPYPADPQGRIALLDRGGCPFRDKVERAKDAGALGAVLINTVDAPLTPQSAGGPVGAFGIANSDGERLKAALRDERVEVTLAEDLREYHDFGGLRLWSLADPSNPQPLATYQTPRSHVDPVEGPAEEGRFSAHNPVVRGNLLFVSWYTDGVRVLDIEDPAAPREIASWTPPARAQPRAIRTYLGDAPQVWGVAVEGDLIVASDINSGLYVLRLVR